MPALHCSGYTATLPLPVLCPYQAWTIGGEAGELAARTRTRTTGQRFLVQGLLVNPTARMTKVGAVQQEPVGARKQKKRKTGAGASGAGVREPRAGASGAGRGARGVRGRGSGRGR